MIHFGAKNKTKTQIYALYFPLHMAYFLGTRDLHTQTLVMQPVMIQKVFSTIRSSTEIRAFMVAGIIII